MLTSEIADNLHSQGWARFSGLLLPDIIDRLVGGGRYLADEIVLRNASTVSRHYSDVYGTGEFPFHTDFAFEKIIPKYIILHCTGSASRRPTIVCRPDLSLSTALQMQIMREEIWEFATGRARILGRIIEKSKERINFRLDPVYMRPFLNHKGDSLRFFLNIIARSPSQKLNWSTGEAVVFDNWRCVHARGAKVDDIEINRRFERVRIYV